MNDLTINVPDHETMYADDTTVIVTWENIDGLESNLLG